ncbi:hypothetical protein BTHI11S_03433 [Bosea thiooxidans]
MLVDDQDAVGVAIERDADIGAQLADLGDERLRMGRADLMVDVEAVRIDADGDDLGAELPERLRSHLVGGAIGAIEHDAQAFQAQVPRQRPLGEFDIARIGAVDALGAAEAGRGREAGPEIGVDQRLDLALHLVVELVAVRPEQLDAVVLIGVVRGRDHHAEIGPHRARQHRDARGRDRAEQHHVHADRGEAGDHGVFDHVAGKPRVLADHDPVSMLASAEGQPRGLADLQGKVWRDDAVRPPANAVRSEIFARHVRFMSERRSAQFCGFYSQKTFPPSHKL